MIGLTISPSVARAALPVVTIVVAVVTGVLLGVEISLLVVAAGALAGVIALLWSSVQALTGESPLTLDEALTLGAPSAEEEQKRAVLRALKDLEFERSVGKISEEDYAELSTRYREDAKRLIQLIDAGTEAERERAEKALTQRLAAAPAKPAKPAKPAEPEPRETDSDESEAEPEPSSPAPATTSEREEEAS
ncbi:MAG TPA: hypothetical protein VNN72_08580 [Polyangiaceae bacterium]|nr:hypothetical protein [Polyangiaceae bacterium]